MMYLTFPSRAISLILLFLFTRALAELSLAEDGTASTAALEQRRRALTEIDVPAEPAEIPSLDGNPVTGDPKKAAGPTEITSLESTYDNGTHIAIFTGGVTLKDPEFNVICDKLTATLRHGPAVPSKKGSSREGGLAKAPAKANSPEQKGGLQKALAESDEGQVVTITQDKVNSDGTIKHSVGHSRKAFYDAETGDVSLTGGKPDMKQDKDLMVALEERTVLILNRDGRTRSVGPSKTYIIQQTPLNNDTPKADVNAR